MRRLTFFLLIFLILMGINANSQARAEMGANLFRTAVGDTSLQKQLAATPKCSADAKTDPERMLERLLRYLRMDSQSFYADPNDTAAFPLTDGQKRFAEYLYQEISGFGGNARVYMSPEYYVVYVHIPGNVVNVPSILFHSHLDVSCEAPGGEGKIHPVVHPNYNGGDILLDNGSILSPDSIEGKHLNNLRRGQTIITSDGSTLLGGDDKCGVAICVSLIKMLLDRETPHGDICFIFSQNEDIGLAANRVDLSFFGNKLPDIMFDVDVDGEEAGHYGAENFTARGYYTMQPEACQLLENAGRKLGMTIKPTAVRGGTTASMMAAKGLPSGPSIYCGVQSAHSTKEWVCVEEVVGARDLCLAIVDEVVTSNKKHRRPEW